VETAALALDLGATDVVAGPVATPELALRARALIVRRHLRRALRAQVRLGLRAALTDPLTGLHNRRYAEAALRRMGEGEQPPGCGLALVMINIDHFKAINDTHGHAAGDRVLTEVARRLRSVLRPSDLVARVGGEEFLVGLGSATPEEAGLLAERLRQSIGGRPFVIDAETRAPSGRLSGLASPQARFGQAALAPEAPLPRVGVTVSVGVAMGPSGRLDSPGSLAALLHHADDALSEAKRAGRDAVSVWAPAAA
jgi:two-component system cell cycle response regulator